PDGGDPPGGGAGRRLRSGPARPGRAGGRPAGAAGPQPRRLPRPRALPGHGATAEARAGLPAEGPGQPRDARSVHDRGGPRLRRGAPGGLGRAARPGRARGAVHGRAGAGRAAAPSRPAADSALAGLDRRPAARGLGPGVAVVSAALRRRGADLPLRQAEPGLDDGPPAPAGGGRPLELAAGAGVLAALVGPAAGRRPAAALGTPAAAGAADPRARPS